MRNVRYLCTKYPGLVLVRQYPEFLRIYRKRAVRLGCFWVNIFCSAMMVSACYVDEPTATYL